MSDFDSQRPPPSPPVATEKAYERPEGFLPGKWTAPALRDPSIRRIEGAGPWAWVRKIVELEIVDAAERGRWSLDHENPVF